MRFPAELVFYCLLIQVWVIFMGFLYEKSSESPPTKKISYKIALL